MSKKINKHIEIIRTEISGYSSMGAKKCNLILEILSRKYSYVHQTVINSLFELESVVAQQPDLIFLGFKKIPQPLSNDDIWIADYLDKAGIAYTGSNNLAIILDYDKEKSKEKLRNHGLATADSFVTLPNTYNSKLPLMFPLFLKPLSSGGGKGIDENSVVYSNEEFANKVDSIFQECSSSTLAEQYLTGKEYSVAIMDNVGLEKPSIMPVEIITSPNCNGDRILGNQIKDQDDEVVLAIADSEKRQEICEFAERIYEVLGGRDFGRLDIREDENGKLHFLEANFMPGPLGYFAAASSINMGLNKAEVVLKIVQTSLARSS